MITSIPCRWPATWCKRGTICSSSTCGGGANRKARGWPCRISKRTSGGAVDYLESRGYPAKRIAILGFCSGAASSAIFASQNSVGALMLVGCFATVHNIVITEAKHEGIPAWLTDIFAPGVLLASEAIYHYKSIDPEDIIGDIACPILFIHEENDEYISRGEMEGLYRAAREPDSEFWQVDNCLHSQAYKTYPLEFIGKVDGFLNKAINK